MLTSLHKDLTTPYKSNSLFFFIKAEAHSLAEELRLCCLCIRYKLARRDGFVGGLSLSYQGYYTSDNLYGNAGYKPKTIATPDLKWEKNEQYNIALDFSFLNRISNTSVNFYR